MPKPILDKKNSTDHYPHFKKCVEDALTFAVFSQTVCARAESDHDFQKACNRSTKSLEEKLAECHTLNKPYRI